MDKVIESLGFVKRELFITSLCIIPLTGYVAAKTGKTLREASADCRVFESLPHIKAGLMSRMYIENGGDWFSPSDVAQWLCGEWDKAQAYKGN